MLQYSSIQLAPSYFCSYFIPLIFFPLSFSSLYSLYLLHPLHLIPVPLSRLLSLLLWPSSSPCARYLHPLPLTLVHLISLSLLSLSLFHHLTPTPSLLPCLLSLLLLFHFSYLSYLAHLRPYTLSAFSNLPAHAPPPSEAARTPWLINSSHT